MAMVRVVVALLIALLATVSVRASDLSPCPQDMAALEKTEKPPFTEEQIFEAKLERKSFISDEHLRTLVSATGQKIVDQNSDYNQPLELYLYRNYYMTNFYYPEGTHPISVMPRPSKQTEFRSFLLDHPESIKELSAKIVDIWFESPTFVYGLSKFPNSHYVNKQHYLEWRGVKNGIDEIKGNPARQEALRQAVEQDLNIRYERLSNGKTHDIKLRDDPQNPEVFMGDMIEIFSLRLPILFHGPYHLKVARILKASGLSAKKVAALDAVKQAEMMRELAEATWQYLADTYSEKKLPGSSDNPVYHSEVLRAQARAKDLFLTYSQYLEAIHLLRQIQQQPDFQNKFVRFLEASMPSYLKVLPSLTTRAWAQEHFRNWTRLSSGSGEETNIQALSIGGGILSTFLGVISIAADSYLPMAFTAALPAIAFGPSAVAITKAKLLGWREKRAKKQLYTGLPGFKGQLALTGETVKSENNPLPEVTVSMVPEGAEATQNPRLHLILREEIAAKVPDLDLADPGSILSYGGMIHTQINSLLSEFSLRVDQVLKDPSLATIGARAKDILAHIKSTGGFNRSLAYQKLSGPLESRMRAIIDYLTATEVIIKDLELSGAKIDQFHDHALKALAESKDKGSNLHETQAAFLEPTLKALEAAKTSTSQMPAIIKSQKMNWTGEIEMIREILQSILIPSNPMAAAALDKSDMQLLERILEYAKKRPGGNK
jgi:hypothetical protein